MFMQHKPLYTIVPIILSLIFQHPVLAADPEELGAISRNETRSSKLTQTKGYIPPVIIIQARVHPTYYENPNVWVDARGKLLPLYKRDALNLPRCISKMKIIYDYVVPEAGSCQDWIRECHIPEVIMDKQYEVLRSSTVKTGEKRLPQLKSWEQSLWSYGATYSMDKSTCQVRQKNFSVDFIDGNPFVKLLSRQGDKQLGGELMDGGFSFFVGGENNPIKKYTSFFIKDIVTGFIHIHCKQVEYQPVIQTILPPTEDDEEVALLAEKIQQQDTESAATAPEPNNRFMTISPTNQYTDVQRAKQDVEIFAHKAIDAISEKIPQGAKDAGSEVASIFSEIKERHNGAWAAFKQDPNLQNWEKVNGAMLALSGLAEGLEVVGDVLGAAKSIGRKGLRFMGADAGTAQDIMSVAEGAAILFPPLRAGMMKVEGAVVRSTVRTEGGTAATKAAGQAEVSSSSRLPAKRSEFMKERIQQAEAELQKGATKAGEPYKASYVDAQVKGAIGEARGEATMLRAGYKKLESKLPGNKGFDGVYVKWEKPGIPSDIVIVESKYATSGEASMAKNANEVTQMSEPWVLDKIEKMKITQNPVLEATGKLLDTNKSLIRRRVNVTDANGHNSWTKVDLPHAPQLGE